MCALHGKEGVFLSRYGPCQFEVVSTPYTGDSMKKQNLMVPHFKKGQHSLGMMAGARRIMKLLEQAGAVDGK